jgi:hypothetical protein
MTSYNQVRVTDVSKEYIASILRVEEQARKAISNNQAASRTYWYLALHYCINSFLSGSKSLLK